MKTNFITAIFIFIAVYFSSIKIFGQSQNSNLSKWQFLEKEVRNKYKIIKKEDKNYFSVENREYRISDILDYGKPYLKVYKNGQKIIFLLEMLDYYGSVFFVYYIDENKKFTRLGDISVPQPENVEDRGRQEITSEISSNGKEVIIEQYLGGKFYGTIKFSLQKIEETSYSSSTNAENPLPNNNLLKWEFLKTDTFDEHKAAAYSQYKFVGNNLSIENREYKIPDILDYGEPFLKVYKNGQKTILLLELLDYYGSTFFVYYVDDNKKFARLGDMSVMQPSNVEDIGMQEITFKISSNDREVIIEQYLARELYGVRKFSLRKVKGTPSEFNPYLP